MLNMFFRSIFRGKDVFSVKSGKTSGDCVVFFGERVNLFLGVLEISCNKEKGIWSSFREEGHINLEGELFPLLSSFVKDCSLEFRRGKGVRIFIYERKNLIGDLEGDIRVFEETFKKIKEKIGENWGVMFDVKVVDPEGFLREIQESIPEEITSWEKDSDKSLYIKAKDGGYYIGCSYFNEKSFSESFAEEIERIMAFKGLDLSFILNVEGKHYSSYLFLRSRNSLKFLIKDLWGKKSNGLEVISGFLGVKGLLENFGRIILRRGIPKGRKRFLSEFSGLEELFNSCIIRINDEKNDFSSIRNKVEGEWCFYCTYPEGACNNVKKYVEEKLEKMDEKRIMESIEMLKKGEVERFCTFMNIKLRSLPCFFRAIMKFLKEKKTLIDQAQELEKILSLNVEEECNYCTVPEKECKYVKNWVYTIIKKAKTSLIEKIRRGFEKDEEIGLKLLFKNLKIPHEYLPCARRTIRYILTQNKKKSQN